MRSNPVSFHVRRKDREITDPEELRRQYIIRFKPTLTSSEVKQLTDFYYRSIDYCISNESTR